MSMTKDSRNEALRRHSTFTLAAAFSLMAISCGKKDAPSTPGAAPAAGAPAAAPGAAAAPDRPHVDGTPHTDDVVTAWKGAGLTTDAFAPIDPSAYNAGYCAQGKIGGLDAVICEYSDDKSLDQGKKTIQGERSKDRVQTGVAIKAKRTLLAVSDREKSDPNGKTINKAIQTFKKM
jgi:hypothetical protein